VEHGCKRPKMQGPQVVVGTPAADTKQVVQVNLSVFHEVCRWYQTVVEAAEGVGQ